MACVQTRQSLLNPFYLRWIEVIRTTARQYQAVVVDTLDYVCGPHLCPCIVENVMQMWDNNHLTLEYVFYITPVVHLELKARFFATSNI